MADVGSHHALSLAVAGAVARSVLGINVVRPYAASLVVDDTHHRFEETQMTSDVEAGEPSPVAASRVVLLADPNWPAPPGVCCWRASVHETFTELGLDVHEIGWSGPDRRQSSVTSGMSEAGGGVGATSQWDPASASGAPGAPGGSAASGPRHPSVAGVAIRFVARAARAGAYAAGRRVRAGAGRVGRELDTRVGRRISGHDGPLPLPTASGGGDVGGTTSDLVPPTYGHRRTASVGSGPTPAPDPRLRELSRVGARLVLAESPDAAVAAVRAGVPPPLVWVLAVPPERAAPGEPVTWASPLREAVPVIGGLVADSPDAAGILERVAGPVRTVVFPPLARDRSCPTCDDRAGAGGTDADDRSRRQPPVHPEDLAGHLRLWRWLLDDQSAGVPTPTEYSYPVARLRGEAGPWLEPTRDPWGGQSFSRTGDDTPDWTVAAQLAGARQLLASLPPAAASGDAAGAPVRLRIFGHDLKFMRDLADVLGDRPDLDVAVDEWRTAGARNDGITENLARSAQTLVAEWARPNAIWLSGIKRPDQRLVVRLHRFEIESQYPRRIDIDSVDAVVYIAPHMGPRIRDELGWPTAKLVYVPNYTDLPSLDRAKLPDARFTLGMVGIVPSLKRFDLALDLLAAVRREDPRFSLLVRSQMGWTHKPSWDLAAERSEVQRCLERVEKDPLLRGAVVFDAFGRDMAAWYRKIGHILSLSDVEGSHTSLCEGMGSGAVPVIRGWQGAVEAYGEDALCGSLDEAVARVLTVGSDAGLWQRRSVEAKRDVASRFDPAEVVAAWVDLAYGRLDDARGRFAAYVDKTVQPG